MAADGQIHTLSVEHQAKIVCAKFEVGDTKLSIKYSLAGVADRDVHNYVSAAAFKRIKVNAPQLITQKGVCHLNSYACFGLRIEHMIPTEIVYRHFDAEYRCGNLSVSYVAHVIRKRLFCALITEDEDDILSDKGLQRRMPDGWNFDVGDILARYKAVGIKMHKFKSANGS